VFFCGRFFPISQKVKSALQFVSLSETHFSQLKPISIFYSFTVYLLPVL